jgi:hypothetical protein
MRYSLVFKMTEGFMNLNLVTIIKQANYHSYVAVKSQNGSTFKKTD